ncbi:MAG: ribonuclease [Acidobacteria bacterium RIFCSPLOWO2_12_FULL_67_14]|nr:MAG: ribonuclease [Acidobacteria bacterium RIFCSPLOWO2_02_FULL_67_21]OFW38772.1 MAG: ribonuclease [Acidobacteria bacterium RIFCSPLOWO2_12_FULL_67_14]
MVLDTSALAAILLDEPERAPFIAAIEAADARRLSAATFVEISIVIEVKRGAEGLRDLDQFLKAADVELVSVDDEQAHAARRAFLQYGKGRHRAGLNFGDCFAYALARTLDEPLLCKGDDFLHTDVIVWRPEPEHEPGTET